ncbi:MAG TPA: DUF4238 domain-containing protein [Candidatus Magasanikbacteria bacterium]|nr:DUF4238 domain-containing protein [Candidatus Magasanikbacteria bacterium]
MRKKNQHYIPQFILDGFLNADDQVIELFIPKEAIYPTSPANAMTENHTYEHPDIQENSIEDLLSRIEDVTAPTVKRLRENAEAVDKGTMNITDLKKRAESLYKFYILSYYRSGALLAESSMFKKEDKIPLLTQKIFDSRYIDALAETMKRGYNFTVLKSNGDFLLSDQCVSTVALQVKSRFHDVSNRNIGLQETLVLIPISSSHYIALWNSKNGFGVKPNTVHEVDEKLLHLINRAIINNSYVKCVAQKTERLQEVVGAFNQQYPSQIFAGGNPDGFSMGAVVKKEVFLTDTETKTDDLLHYALFERYKKVEVNKPCPCGSEKKYKKCHRDAYERTKSVAQTFTGRYPFGEWRSFIIPGVPVIEYPIDRWAGFAKDKEKSQD